MSTLLVLYKNIMNNISNDPESEATYTSQNLKKRLERHFGNNIVFIQQGVAAPPPDLVFSRDINIKDIINLAFKYKESFEDLRAANDMMTSESSTLSFANAQVLFYAFLIVRNLLKDTRGIQHQPLDPSDVTLEKTEELIKNEIYNFLTGFYLQIHKRITILLINLLLENQITVFTGTSCLWGKILSTCHQGERQKRQNILV